MIFKKVGIFLKENTKTKLWWVKLAMALIFSNIFFFILFADDSKVKQIETPVPQGWIEVQLEAKLLTPFHSGKKVLIINRQQRKSLYGVLHGEGVDPLGRVNVLVKEENAHALFLEENWEILPYLKQLTFASTRKDNSHEIRY